MRRFKDHKSAVLSHGLAEDAFGTDRYSLSTAGLSIYLFYSILALEPTMSSDAARWIPKGKYAPPSPVGERYRRGRTAHFFFWVTWVYVYAGPFFSSGKICVGSMSP